MEQFVLLRRRNYLFFPTGGAINAYLTPRVQSSHRVEVSRVESSQSESSRVESSQLESTRVESCRVGSRRVEIAYEQHPLHNDFLAPILNRFSIFLNEQWAVCNTFVHWCRILASRTRYYAIYISIRRSSSRSFYAREFIGTGTVIPTIWANLSGTMVRVKPIATTIVSNYNPGCIVRTSICIIEFYFYPCI